MKLTLQLIAYIVKIQGLGGGRVVKGSRFMPKKLQVASLIPAAMKIFFWETDFSKSDLSEKKLT